mmetsp:Transcript_44438/g.93282  ORF Transcript_44438/g.93282 Transcript_44438/m.93282 type:complete len:246 (-) Transcript_44438:505-1242(-)
MDVVATPSNVVAPSRIFFSRRKRTLILRQTRNDRLPHRLCQFRLRPPLRLHRFVHHHTTDATRRSKGKDPMRWHNVGRPTDGNGDDRFPCLVCHFEGSIFEGHKPPRSRSCSFWEGAEIDAIIKPLHSLLQSQKLRSSIRPIYQHILRNFNGLPENGHLFQFFLGNEFIVEPTNGVAQEGNVHPRIVVGYEHGCATTLMKLLNNLPILNLRKTPRKKHQQRSPNMTKEHGYTSLLINFLSGNFVE